MRTLQLSCPSGTLAPLNTGYTTILPVPKSVPTAEWIRDALSRPVVFPRPLTPYFGQFLRHLHTARLGRQTLCLSGRLVPVDQTAVLTADSRYYHSSHQNGQPCSAVHQDTGVASLLPGPHST